MYTVLLLRIFVFTIYVYYNSCLILVKIYKMICFIFYFIVDISVNNARYVVSIGQNIK